MSAIVNFFRYEFCEIKDFQVVSERVVRLSFRFRAKFVREKYFILQYTKFLFFCIKKVYLDNCEAIAKEKEELMAKNYALKSERTEKKILIENVSFFKLY